MAHQFKSADRNAEMLLPHNMLDWVPEGHAVRVVTGTVEQLVTRDLMARLVPPAEKGAAPGPARYDPVMLVTVRMYAYLRGVLSTRAVEDRCRCDATFRVACGREIPDHTTFSRFRRHLFAQDGLAEELSYRVLRVCACAGPGRLPVAAGDGVKIAADAPAQASRTGAGLRRLAAQARRAGRRRRPGRRRRLPQRSEPDRARTGPAHRRRQDPRPGPRARRRPPPAGATAVQASAHRLATPEGRAAYKRRAPDAEGPHASLKDDGGLRRFSLRGLHNATSEFLFAGLAHNLRLLAAIS